MNKKFFFQEFNKIKNQKYNDFKKYLKRDSEKDYIICLDKITKILNKAHDIKLGSKNWNYLIGPWLKYNLDMYHHKNFLIDNVQNFKSFFKKKKKNYINIPNDFSEFTNSNNGKNFNENLIRYILYENKNFIFKNKVFKTSFTEVILFFYLIIFKIINFLFVEKKTIAIDGPKDQNFLKKNTNYIFSPYSNLRSLFFNNVNFEKRDEIIKKLKNSKDKDNQLHKKIIYLISIMPINYIENYKKLKFFSKLLFFGDKFYSRVSHIDNELFKFYLAHNNKRKLYLDQHGGNFSFVDESLYISYDKKISNKIYFWDKINNTKYKSNFNSAKLTKKNLYKGFFRKYDACYVMSFSKSFDYQNEFHENYNYEKKIMQMNNFSNNYNNKKNLIIKIPPNRYDSQINQKKLTKYGFKKLQISENKLIFYESKILIFEHFSTVIFETRCSNTPFIIITDLNDHFLSREGEFIISILKKENLIFKNGLEAAKFLNKINNIDYWWSKKKYNLDKIFYD